MEGSEWSVDDREREERGRSLDRETLGMVMATRMAPGGEPSSFTRGFSFKRLGCMWANKGQGWGSARGRTVGIVGGHRPRSPLTFFVGTAARVSELG